MCRGTTPQYTYGESGNPFSFEYYSSATDNTPDKYYYVFNLQGDVIQLRTADGTIVANYVYDAWGKPVSVTGNPDIAQINPLRYRGYFYDTETGLYYCNSRYYDPEVKRWINADGYITTGQGFVSYNMYSYCLNNPVMYYDTTGTKPGVNNTYVCSDGGSMSMEKYYQQKAQKIGRDSNITPEYISIDLDKNNDEITHISNVTGDSLAAVCKNIAIGACEQYEVLTGEAFILSDDCVANEIEEHIVAYRWSIDETTLPNAIAIGFSINKDFPKQAVYRATVLTDIRVSDVKQGTYNSLLEYAKSQAIVFDYKKGIRDVYIGTSKDPWVANR